MFPFFNKDFFKSMLENQKELEMKAPNGAIYRFSTNSMDDKTFDQFRRKLEEAVKNNDQEAFDKAWNEFTGKSQLLPNIETEIKKFHSDMQKFFQETSSLFKNFDFPMLSSPFFSERQALTEESIDRQIEHYQRKIEELQNKKTHIDKEKKKLEIQEKIKEKKDSLDAKLDEFAKNLDNDKMKKRLTDEMTKLNEEIKQLEKELEKLQ